MYVPKHVLQHDPVTELNACAELEPSSIPDVDGPRSMTTSLILWVSVHFMKCPCAVYRICPPQQSKTLATLSFIVDA